jgi:hypothetical protein
MVSFSCDNCQDVVTKPKVIYHFQSCRTQSVSCIDCGVVFNSHSVKAHTSCISEAQKHGPKGGGRQNTESYCADCSLPLNGAVHSLQHYESKKHKSAVRKKKAAEKATKVAAAPLLEPIKAAIPVAPSHAEADVLVEDLAPAARAPKSGKTKASSLKKVMKLVLRKAPGGKLRTEALEQAVRDALGDGVGEDLAARVQKRSKQAPFRASKSTVELLSEDA